MLLSALTALSVLLTLIVTITASYQSQRKTLYATTLQLNNSSADKMSLTMNSLFQAMRLSLRTTAGYMKNTAHLTEGDVLDHLEYARNASSYFNSIFWADNDGIVRSISPPAVSLKGTKLTTKASQEALASRKPYLSTPYVGTTGRLIVLMSEPLFDKNGEYRGFIGGTIYLQDTNVLSAIYGSNLIDNAGSYFYVIDPNGKLIYHPDKERLGEDVTDNRVVQMLMKGRTGEAKVTNTKGRMFLAGFATVADNGWGIVVQSPVETVYTQLNRQIRSTILYMGLPFLLIMLAVVYVARKLASPFAMLTDYVGQAAEGAQLPPPLKPNHWNREANVLTKTVVIAVEAMRKQSEALTQAAMVDPLTGLMNRRAMEDVLGKWTSLDAPFALIVMDIDRFKCVNDTLGHQVGDEVLKRLAEVVQRCVRADDICCRFGGEEFVVLLPEIDAEEAVLLAERIRQTMEKEQTPANRTVTVSLGVAAYPMHGREPYTLFKIADEALYAAKESGRNRTVLAGAATERELIASRD